MVINHTRGHSLIAILQIYLLIYSNNFSFSCLVVTLFLLNYILFYLTLSHTLFLFLSLAFFISYFLYLCLCVQLVSGLSSLSQTPFPFSISWCTLKNDRPYLGSNIILFEIVQADRSPGMTCFSIFCVLLFSFSTLPSQFLQNKHIKQSTAGELRQSLTIRATGATFCKNGR